MTTLALGTIHTLLVDGKTEHGFILTKGMFETILPFSEETEAVMPGQMIDVFLYKNKQGNIEVTSYLPHIVSGAYGWAKVVDIVPRLGVFVHIGAKIEVLVPKDSLPFVHRVWPQHDDELYITLTTDKQQRLLGVLATEATFTNLFRLAATHVALNDQVTGRVIRSEREGAVILTEEGYRCFIHHSQMDTEPRLGEIVQGRVIEVKEDGTLNGSLLPLKHERMDEDASKILNYIERANGVIPFSDRSHPEDIRETFQMSKSAFKRALGRLMKQNKVYQENNHTYLIEED